MSQARIDCARLLCGVATMALATAASHASAQTIHAKDLTPIATVAQPAASPAAAAAPADALSEIVVTATRQSSTVNKVPLSITAVTQQTLDQEGVKNISDLARVVPGIGFRSTGSDRSPQIAIRGIASSAGARTTGVYMDDVPLQQTGISSGPVSGANTPLPQIFDLARVEILKGPQGTLYGGSAEGGAIRFISPTPSLTTFSGNGKVEASNTDNGAPSYNVGAAIGGPIFQDKLGFRFSAYDKHVGGYIDDVSRFTGATVAKDVDYENAQAFRLALRWAPTEHLEISPSFYYSNDYVADQSQFWENIKQYSTATTSYTTTGAVTTSPSTTHYTELGHTYGPYNMYGPYKSGNLTNVGDNFANSIPLNPVHAPSNTQLSIASVNAKYELPFATANLILSHVDNNTEGWADAVLSDTFLQSGSPFVYNLPSYTNTMYYNDHHNQDMQEFRLTSPGDQRLTWTAGLYHSHSRQTITALTYWNYNDLTEAVKGVADTVIYGVPAIDTKTGLASFRDENLLEEESAVYGEANFMVTSKLKVTAGVRYSRESISYTQTYFGQSLGTFIPTIANGGLTSNASVETPVTPKFGISYQFDPATMAYANAAKGFRVGGVNVAVSQIKCAGDLATIGLTQIPQTYQSDSVWNYEAGVKTRLFGRAQVNADIFYVDWQNPQTKISLPTCGGSYVAAVGHAVSKGGEVAFDARIGHGFSISGQVSYTDAYYTQPVGLNTPTHPIFQNAGDKLPVPPLAINAGVRYDFETFNLPSYFRFDYQYSDPYQQGPGPGTLSYAPDTFILGMIHEGSMRLGTRVNRWDVSVYSNNVFASKDITALAGGRTACATAACTSFRSNQPIFTGTTLRPREEGVTLTYAF
jgi:iron complex outermembrane receptor protein